MKVSMGNGKGKIVAIKDMKRGDAGILLDASRDVPAGTPVAWTHTGVVSLDSFYHYWNSLSRAENRVQLFLPGTRIELEVE